MESQLSKSKVNNGQFTLHTKHNLKTPLGSTLGTKGTHWELEGNMLGGNKGKMKKKNLSP